MRPKICFIGNCQAQALQSLCAHLRVDAEVLPLPAVFNVQEFDTNEIYDKIERADFIFNQRVSDDYQIERVRPKEVRSRFAGKSYSWPNIYFDGYFPGIGYIYTHGRDGGGKLTGPLGDYHFLPLLHAWSVGTGVDTAKNMLLAGSLPGMSATPVEDSLSQLRARERGLDIIVSDFISARFRYERLQYSMNHPSNTLLLLTLQRLLETVGIRVENIAALASYPYTLNQFVIPPFDYVRRVYGLKFEIDDAMSGKSVSIQEKYVGEGPDTTNYNWEVLVETYYRLYDAAAALGTLNYSNGNS